MSSLISYIRTSNSNKSLVYVKFQLRDKNVSLNYTSEIEIAPKLWDPKKQGHRTVSSVSDQVKFDFNKQILNRKKLILDLYKSLENKESISSETFTSLINSKLVAVTIPDATPKNTSITLPNTIQSTTHIKQTNEIDITTVFDMRIKGNEISPTRKKTYGVVKYSLLKFIYLKQQKKKDFSLTFENTDIHLLWELEEFFRNEPNLIKINPKVKTVFKKYREPHERAENTVIGFMRILRAVFNFAIKQELTTNYPFKKYKMKEQIFGTPYYPTKEEILHLYNFDFGDEKLNEQRDVFIMQSMVGMRINDFYNLTRNNIVEDNLEYIPCKTKHLRAKVLSIPLNSIALSILKKYEGQTKILPFTTEPKYNLAIKKVFLLAGLDRKVTILDPKTRMEVVKPLYEIMHSHSARIFFCGSLFEEVSDQSLISEMSGHAPQSIAFERYRHINRTMKEKLTNTLCENK
jgi:integrase